MAVTPILIASWTEHARWIEIDRGGVRYATFFGARFIAWDAIASIERARARRLVVLRSRARRGSLLELNVELYGARLFDVLRENAPVGVYQLRADDERALVSGVRSQDRERARARVMMKREPRASYRGIERARSTFSLRRPFGPERRAFRRAFVVSMGFGLSTMYVAWLITTAQLALAMLVLLGAIALAAFLLSRFLGIAIGLRALRRRLIDRLGPEVELDPRGMLISRDRRTRVRQLPSDLDDRLIGLHLHVETLGDDGLIESSAIVLGLDLGLPADARPWTLRETARVRGHALSSLDDDTWPVEPRLLRTDRRPLATLVIEHGPDGAILSRFGGGERPLGDTFHEDADAARRQAAHETEHFEWHDTMEGR
ncbi:Hypothetical protein I5071_81220 [Sandaracinus amylolyticus]|nr:Hypothetical protein I5071_81220 [Sandaracinus amylolyticus]